MTWADARTLLHLLRGQSGRGTHRDRLQRFYAPQAAHYDTFRERLLHGRRALIEQLNLPPAAHLVELGAGTGRNLEFFGERLATMARVELVDLCPALLEQARARAARWPQVGVIEGDATRYRPEQPMDCVIFSYALTMVPDWFAAVDNAVAMLKPGGVIGVVDFHVSRRHEEPPRRAHGRWTRWFWPLWFGHDGVRLNSDHLPYLQTRFETLHLDQRDAPVPYLPGLRVPYYLFLGRKRQHQPRP